MTATIVAAIALSVLGPVYQLWRARAWRRNFASLAEQVAVLIVVELMCLVVFRQMQSQKQHFRAMWL